ncbi:ABC-2 transporter permease [Mediterraneibacter glycyrrhizinilyticus]|uniref:ABC-2 transporter permease n=1 Tax=Mediterraneibacter glycyrrhizinilyticus TaxID=342942 RepID=UPI00195F90CF|nr:ABC-2 transporter permease [Mediterraneibacter glycyrrhizinilyticus]MBM6751557.1 ABC-2 transporter permease [Mediterraneibacter glycyrrhizinilyticus]
MKGLLIKDFQLAKTQGKMLLIVALVIGVFMEIAGMSEGFVTGYITIIMSVFAATSISYDEYENCFSFLLVLPVSRKEYVNEKYVFSGILIFSAWLVGLTVGSVFRIIRGEPVLSAEWLAGCFSYITVAVVFLSLMLPLRLKFEGEKGRVVLPIAIAAMGILIYGGVKLANLAGIDVTGSSIKVLNQMGAAGIMAMLVIIPVAAAVISWICSRHILEKKEF